MTSIDANTLKGLAGKLRSFKLGGIIGYWAPKACGKVGSLESDSMVTICGSGEATDEIVIVSGSIAPENCVELGIIGVLCLMGLLSGDDCST